MELATFKHIYEPATAEGLPMLLLFHGTGGDERDLIPLALNVLPGATLLSVKGQVSEGGMARFFRRFAEGVFDVEDLKLRVEEFAEWYEVAKSRYKFGSRPVYALGYSNGANFAAAIAMLRPDILNGGALIRPMVPFLPEHAPGLDGKAFLLCIGERDAVVSPESGRELGSILESFGASVTVSEQDASHQLTIGDVRACSDWFEELAL